tara:strand:- start:417 stop:1031 length:615 start_codon:yes stop_codon:yes gene_type:complete
MDGNTVLRSELDRGENRVIERWKYYLPGRLIKKIWFSRGGDEVVDTWAYEDGDGAVAGIEISILHNGQVDRREHYEADILARAEDDMAPDGQPDEWETHSGSLFELAAFDENGDGVPDRRLLYAGGALLAIESTGPKTEPTAPGSTSTADLHHLLQSVLCNFLPDRGCRSMTCVRLESCSSTQQRRGANVLTGMKGHAELYLRN